MATGDTGSRHIHYGSHLIRHSKSTHIISDDRAIGDNQIKSIMKDQPKYVSYEEPKKKWWEFWKT